MSNARDNRVQQLIRNIDLRLIQLAQLGLVPAPLGAVAVVGSLGRRKEDASTPASASQRHSAVVQPQSAANGRPPPTTKHLYKQPRQNPSVYTIGKSFEPFTQIDTAVRGMANTFGGNQFSALMDANFRAGAPTWTQRRQENLAAEASRDAYDAEHRPTARALGQLGGIAAAILLSRGRAAPTLLPEAATISGRELAWLLTGGGATGLGSRLADDAISGKRSTVGDKGAAILGGMTNTALLPFGTRQAAGGGGAMTSIAEDVFNGRDVSLERAGQAYNLGHVFAAVPDEAGIRLTNGMSSRDKGLLGEAMGAGRSALNGNVREQVARQLETLPNGARTYFDGRSGNLRFEDKFGNYAKLSKGQRGARAWLGDDYIVYHFLPEHVGAAVSAPVAITGSQIARDRYPE